MKTFIGLTAFATLALSASAQSFDRAAQEAQERKDEALQELEGVYAQINEEKPDLAAALDTIEQEVFSLRSKAQDAQRTIAGSQVNIDNLRTELTSAQDNNSYIASTLLNEYVRRFELGLDYSERGIYTDLIVETKNVVEGEQEFTDAEIFTQQLEMLDVALSRLEGIIGGHVMTGEASVNNEIIDGQFLLYGPVSYFAGNGVAGISTSELEGRASIYELPVSADAIASAMGGEGLLPLDSTDGEAIIADAEELTLTEEWARGGMVMYPILGLFAIAILISLYKAFALFTVKSCKQKDVDAILEKLKSGDQAGAVAYANGIGGPAGAMLTAAAENAHEDKEVIEEVIYEKIINTQPKLERFLSFIAVVAATAPLLGLLGTVTGMIKTFKLITIVGTGDARNLSSGISEALITTKWGLIVAIPTLIFHALLNRKAKGVIGSMEQTGVSFINGLAEMKEAPAQDAA